MKLKYAFLLFSCLTLTLVLLNSNAEKDGGKIFNNDALVKQLTTEKHDISSLTIASPGDKYAVIGAKSEGQFFLKGPVVRSNAEKGGGETLNNDALVKQLTTEKHDISSLTIASPGDKYAVIGTKREGQFFLRGPSGSEYKQMSLSLNPDEEITTTTFSSDGKWLVFGTNYGLTRLYKVSTLWNRNGNGAGKGVILDHQHNNQVNAVAFSPDAKMFASGGTDRILLVSSLESSSSGNLTLGVANVARVLRSPITAITFSSDAKTLAVGARDGTISLLDVANGQVNETYPNDWAINALAFSPDGKTLASGIEDGKMVVRNTLSHKELISQPQAHAYKINVLVFSPDGKMLASGGPDRKVRLWDTQSGKKVGEMAYEREVLDVVFSADGQALTVGDKTGRIARSKTAEFMDAKPQPTQPLIAQQNRQNTSPRTRRFQKPSQPNATKQKEQNTSISNSKPAALYDKIEALNSKPVYTVTFVPSDDNRTYLLGQRDSFIFSSSDTPIQFPQRSVGNVVSAAFSPATGYAIARSNDSKVWLVDPSDKFKKSQDLDHDFNANAVAFSPDRITLAVGTATGVSLWNASDTELLPKNQQPKAPGSTKTLAFSPDGRILAIGQKTGVIQLWDLSANANLKSLPRSSNFGVQSLAFSPDSKTLAVARSMSREIERWNIPNSQKLLPLKLDTSVGHTLNMVNTVKFSPDGKTLASGHRSGKVLLWDVQTSAEIDPIQRYNTKYPQSKDKYIGHEDAVLSVAFSDDGNTLKSGDATGVILLWNLSTIDITANPNLILAYKNEKEKIVQNANRQKAETSDQDLKQHTPIATVPNNTDSPILLDDFESSVRANVSTYDLSGKINAENAPYKVKINDTDAEMLPDGKHFEASVALNEGANPIIIVATDKNGESFRRNIEIERKPKPDKIAPAIIDLDYKSTVGRAVRTTIIKGRVEDDKSGIAKVEINGKGAKVEFASTTDRLTGSFQKQVTLDEGDNQFTITATDHSAKKTEKTIAIHRELTPPVITVINPQLDLSTKSAKTWKNTVQIRVEVTDESGIAEVKSSGGGGYAPMSLASKLNKGGVYASTYDHFAGDPVVNFTIIAKDTKGREASERIVINFAKDKIKPIISNSTESRVDSKTVHIRVKVTDSESGIKDVKLVKLDGQEVALTPSDDGDIFHLVKLREGDNLFKILATDQMNNTAKAEIPIHRVPTSPPIEIPVSLPDGATDTVKIEAEDPVSKTGPSNGDSTLPDTTPNRKMEENPPDVKFSNPDLRYKKPCEVNEAEFVLIFKVYDESELPEKIKIYRVVRFNTEEVTEAAKIEKSDAYEFKYEARLPLHEGQNKFEMVVRDQWGNSTVENFTIVKHQKAIDQKEAPNTSELEITQQFDRTNKDFALFFPIGEYLTPKDAKGNWIDLKGPIRDAKAVAENLRNNYGFQTRVFEEDFTKQQILNTIYNYSENFEGIKYTEGSQLLLFFSGHGYFHEEEDAGYLIAADTKSPLLDRKLDSALSHNELREQIESINCPRLLVLLDTCESGTFDPNYRVPSETKNPFDGMAPLKEIKEKLQFEARWCMTAAGIGKVVDSTENVSPFAQAFLNALNTKGGDDFVLTLDEVWKEIEKSKDHPIYDKIIKHYKGLSERHGKDFNFKRPEPRKGQFGEAHLPESDFLFLPKEIK